MTAMQSAQPADDRVAVVGGSGALGFGLALRLGASGTHVVVGSRSAERGAAAVERLKEAAPDADFDADANGPAAQRCGVVILSVPFSSQLETLKGLHDWLRPGQILVDATVPLASAVSGKATRTLTVWQGSAAQQAKEVVPDGVRVVSALHTVSASLLADLAEPLDQDVLLCGDRRADKARVSAVLQSIPGLRCVDCGPLEQARITEQLTALMIGVNIRYHAHAGIRITGIGAPPWAPVASTEPL